MKLMRFLPGFIALVLAAVFIVPPTLMAQRRVNPVKSASQGIQGINENKNQIGRAHV